MGNRLSGLWCKKTTLSITHEEQPNPRETRNDKGPRNSNKSNRNRTKSSGSSDGRGIFRLGSVRRLSLRDNPSRAIKTPLDKPCIATIEQTFQELTKPADLDSNMKVNAQLMPTVKVSCPSNTSLTYLNYVICFCLYFTDLNSNRNRYACRVKNKRQT